MKKYIISLAVLAVMFSAGSASAFAVYNHVNKKVCVQTMGNEVLGDCYFRIPASGTKNGAKGSGLDNVRAYWFSSETTCRGSGNFSIPKSGYARIYSGKVELYNKKDEKVGTSPVEDMTCPGIILKK